jgi:hypothetical protein
MQAAAAAGWGGWGGQWSDPRTRGLAARGWSAPGFKGRVAEPQQKQRECSNSAPTVTGLPHSLHSSAAQAEAGVAAPPACLATPLSLASLPCTTAACACVVDACMAPAFGRRPRGTCPSRWGPFPSPVSWRPQPTTGHSAPARGLRWCWPGPPLHYFVRDGPPLPAATVFFSHNRSANSIFSHLFSAKRTDSLTSLGPSLFAMIYYNSWLLINPLSSSTRGKSRRGSSPIK